MNPISIVIPVRIESMEREENLRFVVSYLLKYPFVYIDIIEADKEQCFYFHAHDRIRYHFILDNEIVFYRTHYLNMLLMNAEFSVVGVWDTDILVSQKQLLEAIKIIEKGGIMSFPYDGEFRMLSREDSILIRNGIQTLTPSSGASLMKRLSVGGAFLVNKEKYLLAGGENEGFYGWGPEDVERVKRLEILEYPVARTEGPCYHLWHPRISESGVNKEEMLTHNRKMLLYTCNKTKEELALLVENHENIFSYMNSWKVNNK